MSVAGAISYVVLCTVMSVCAAPPRVRPLLPPGCVGTGVAATRGPRRRHRTRLARMGSATVSPLPAG